ncbi:folate-binding protein [Corynebacterium sp.]|uniref:CAF17-like 4Fe-4S cluster assembly/insertion protein YgfZ n=1 Tax=Corynebacterium sp. TaxID=1720 RepID=UPI0025BE86DF|nr:folate-binding protein [Corynebacterium sp.]
MSQTHSPLVDHVPGASTEDGTVSEGHRDLLAATARHYGQPLIEQSFVDGGGTGVIDGWPHTAILVSGPDAATWLNDLISQKVDAITVGTSTRGLILDVQGRVEHAFGISAVDDDVLLLDAPGDTDAAALAEFLSRMVFWSQVEVSTPELSLLSVVNPEVTPAAAAGTGGPEGVAAPDVRYWATRTLGGHPVTDLWVDTASLTAAWDSLVADGARPVGGWAADALRIRDRHPLLGVDTDERVIPHEVPGFIGGDTPSAHGATQLARADDGPTSAAVHLNKGCYRGQETVSRVHNLGRPPRQLVVLQLDGSGQSLPEVGAAVQAGGRTVGRVGLTVQDADEGPVALALVKRQVIEKLASDRETGGNATPPLTVDGVDAAVDPDDIVVDTAVRPGRAAVDKLRGKI